MPNVSELYAQLQAAFADAKAAHEALENAKAALAPLEAAALEKDDAVQKVLAEYHSQTGSVSTPRRKRGSRGGARPRTAQQNVEIQMKKARTQGEKQGLKGKKLDDFVAAAGKKAAEKAGIEFSGE